jgi:hypothetical protein
MAIAAINRIIPVAKEIGCSSLKGACIGAGLGVTLGAIFHTQQDTICMLSPRLEGRWICYLHFEIGKYAVVPSCAIVGFVSGAAYGTYKQLFKNQAYQAHK